MHVLLAVAILLVCQYHCNRLPGKTRLQNDLICVERDVKLYSITLSFLGCKTPTNHDSKHVITGVQT